MHTLVWARALVNVSGSKRAPAAIGRASRGVGELARFAPPQQTEERIHRDPGSERKELWERAARFLLLRRGEEGRRGEGRAE